MAQITKFFHVWRSIRITPPHKRNFWSPKVSASIHHQVHANVSERHVPLRLLHPCSSKSERNTDTCNCCNANAWKRHIPSRLLHLCSSESECKRPHLQLLQPVIDDNLDLWLIIPVYIFWNTCQEFITTLIGQVYMKMPKIGLGKNASIKWEYKASGIIKMPLTLPHSRVATQTFFNASWSFYIKLQGNSYANSNAEICTNGKLLWFYVPITKYVHL